MTDEFPLPVLVAFGLSSATPKLLEGGRMNRHWLVGSPSGQLVIRRSNLTRTAPAVLWEHALVRFAGSRQWPVALPLPTSNGSTVFEHDGAVWSVAPFLEGDPGREDSPALRTIYGRLLARLHRDLQSFPEAEQRPGIGKTWELDIMVEPAGAGSFNALLAAFAREHPELAANIRRQRYRNLRELSRLHYPDLPDRPIHGDFQPWNLLFREGQLSGVLDFDQCRRDALACDIAPLLVPFQPLDIRLATAFLRGYESVLPLSDAEWELLPALIRAALLWWLAHLLVRWRLDGGDATAIARTINHRFPALDAAEPAFRAIRAGSQPRSG